MKKSNYFHYPMFTRRYVRLMLRQLGISQKSSIPETIVFKHLLDDRELMATINGEIFMLEWQLVRSGKHLVPEPLVSEWFKTFKPSKIQGCTWSWPFEFSTVSLPAEKKFCGHQVDGILVAWVESSKLHSYYNEFLRSQQSETWFEPTNTAGRRLIIAIHNPLEKQPTIYPNMLRSALTHEEIIYFINSGSLVHMDSHSDSLNDEEDHILNSVVKYVLSMGSLLSEHPEMLISRPPCWLKNKHPTSKKGATVTVESRAIDKLKSLSFKY